MPTASTRRAQDKQKEIDFFGGIDLYDVFTPESNQQLLDAFKRLTGLSRGARVADLGCGSGVFTELLRQAGYDAIGLDLSPKLVAAGRAKHPGLELIEGDVEQLPWATASFDGVLLSGIVHHLPDPRRCAGEVFRVLRPGGRFMAFDPNRMNPFMYLYRDRTSPFYSSAGVTENERPVLAGEVARIFRAAGLVVHTDYLAGLKYSHVASNWTRSLLPIYHAIDRIFFSPRIMMPMRPFLLTYGVKP
jgi:SAM-dependent methyltransferase